MASLGDTSFSLARYRPYVFVLAGVLAAAGVYTIYTSAWHPQRSGLHRSNAVHRRRRLPHSRNATEQQIRPPDPRNEQPELADDTANRHYGVYTFSHPQTQEIIEILLDPDNLPSLDIFRNTYILDESSAEFHFNSLQQEFLNNFLTTMFPNGLPLFTEPETLTVWPWLIDRGIRQENVLRALQAFSRTASFQGQADGGRAMDDRETVLDGATDVSWQDGINPTGASDGQTLKSMLFYIAEEQARQEGVIHRGVICNGCNTKPIRGIRWHCSNCADFDLCSDCEATNMHTKTHIFYKVRIPAPYLGYPRQAQPVVYPGKPHMLPRIIPNPLKKRMVKETKYEPEEIDALYDQFTCLANHQWVEDPNELGYAIDRRAFDKSFIPRYGLTIPAPNLIYDRMFSIYDSDGNGLIGFEEFLKGLSGVHTKDPSVKCQHVFAGFDIDGDGYVSRKDFLRMFRAFYAMQKQITRDFITAHGEDLNSAGALDTIESSQPLSAAFTDPIIPSMSELPQGKRLDRFNDPIENELIRDQPDPTRDEIITCQPDDGAPKTDSSPQEERARQEGRIETLRERYERREFYVDEEEGFSFKESLLEAKEALKDLDGKPSAGEVLSDQDEEKQDEENGENRENEEEEAGPSKANNCQETPNSSRRHSRSSSRVRFQDDPEFDTRSNASTSSRPMGERWGGYEVPEAEKDLGREVLYQVTQQGLNELLDPFFKAKEDTAMEVFQTRAERRRWHKEIKQYIEQECVRINEARANDSLVQAFYSSDTPPVMRGFTECLAGGSWRLAEVISQSSSNFTEEGALQVLANVVSRARNILTVDMARASNLSEADIQAARTMEANLLEMARERVMDAWRQSQENDTAQQEEEFIDPERISGHPLEELLRRAGYTAVDDRSPESRPSGAMEASEEEAEQQAPDSDREPARYDSPHRDPTMPQFRPNSAADISSSPSPLAPPQITLTEPPSSPFSQSPSSSSRGMNGSPNPTPSSSTSPKSNSPISTDSGPSTRPFPRRTSSLSNANGGGRPPSRARLEHLAILDEEEKEITERGGAGRLSFDEFERTMLSPEGQKLAFVGTWLEMATF